MSEVRSFQPAIIRGKQTFNSEIDYKADNTSNFSSSSILPLLSLDVTAEFIVVNVSKETE